MKFELIKLADLSGEKTTIYTVYLFNDNTTLFERFIQENREAFTEELDEILSSLHVIAHETGAIEPFFKCGQGKPGDDVCYLKYKHRPRRNLRLYCIRFSNVAIVLGGGGYKEPGLKAFQEKEKLLDENAILREVSEKIYQRIIDKEISWSADGTELTGELEFTDED